MKSYFVRRKTQWALFFFILGVLYI